MNEVFKRDAFVVKENNQKFTNVVENQFVIEDLWGIKFLNHMLTLNYWLLEFPDFTYCWVFQSIEFYNILHDAKG